MMHEGKCKIGDFGFAKDVLDDKTMKHTHLGNIEFYNKLTKNF